MQTEKTDRIRCVVYSRVSTQTQERDGTSLEKQEEAGRSYAALAGWEVVGAYREDFTGASELGERPEGAKVLDLAERGEVQAVVLWGIDRLARKASSALRAFDEFERLGIVLAFSSERVDTSTPSGRMMRTMLAGMAEYERDIIQGRTQTGRFDKTKKHGRWAGGSLYGYRLTEETPQRLVAVPEEAAAVRRAFEMRAAGASTTAIAVELDRLGQKGRSRKNRKLDVTAASALTRTTITKWFTQTVYKGDPYVKTMRRDAKSAPETFTWQAEAIVDPALWQRANEVKIRGDRPAPGSDRRLYALSERLEHIHDDGTAHAMHGVPHRSKKGDVRRLYACEAGRPDSQRGQKKKGCSGFGKVSGQPTTRVSADRLEALFLHWALDKLSDPAALAAYARDADAKLAALAPEDDLGALKAKRDALATKRERYADLYAGGDIDREMFERKTAPLDEEVDALARLIEDAEAAQEARAEFALTIEALMTMPVDWGAATAPDDDAEVAPRGSDEWRRELREAIVATLTKTGPYGRVVPLPSWAVEEAKFLADTFGARLEVTAATEADLPEWAPDGRPAEWPRVRFGFDPRTLQRVSKRVNGLNGGSSTPGP